MDEEKEPPKTIVSAIASAIAAALIQKALDEGKTIEIPSLGITLKKEEEKDE